MAALPASVNPEAIITNPAEADLPFSYVTLKELHRGTNGKLIIHIQDAHSNLSGQENLARTLDHLLGRYNIPIVFVEGGDRDVTLDEVKKIAEPGTWDKVAKRLMYDGVISGEEYLNLTTDHPMKLLGIEYADLYKTNLQAYADLVQKRKAILLYLHKIRTSLSRVKNKIYSKDLLDFEVLKKNSEDGTFGSMNEKLFDLAEKGGVAFTDFPSVEALRGVQAKEKTISFAAAGEEQARLFEALGRAGAAEDIKEFVDASKRTKNAQVSHFMLLSRILKTAESRGVAAKGFPELVKYRDYLEAFSKLDFDPLMQELEKLEDAVYAALAPAEDARKVRAIDRYIGLLENAYGIRMSSREFAMLTANEPAFPTAPWQAFLNEKLKEYGFFEDMIPYQPLFEGANAALKNFYELVDRRDFAFLENAERMLASESQNAAFLIAGGYHTEHLTQLMRERGYSYLVLTPVVEFETDHAKYEQILLSPLEESGKGAPAGAGASGSPESAARTGDLRSGSILAGTSGSRTTLTERVNDNRYSGNSNLFKKLLIVAEKDVQERPENQPPGGARVLKDFHDVLLNAQKEARANRGRGFNAADFELAELSIRTGTPLIGSNNAHVRITQILWEQVFPGVSFKSNEPGAEMTMRESAALRALLDAYRNFPGTLYDGSSYDEASNSQSRELSLNELQGVSRYGADKAIVNLTAQQTPASLVTSRTESDDELRRNLITGAVRAVEVNGIRQYVDADSLKDMLPSFSPQVSLSDVESVNVKNGGQIAYVKAQGAIQFFDRSGHKWYLSVSASSRELVRTKALAEPKIKITDGSSPGQMFDSGAAIRFETFEIEALRGLVIDYFVAGDDMNLRITNNTDIELSFSQAPAGARTGEEDSGDAEASPAEVDLSYDAANFTVVDYINNMVIGATDSIRITADQVKIMIDANDTVARTAVRMTAKFLPRSISRPMRAFFNTVFRLVRDYSAALMRDALDAGTEGIAVQAVPAAPVAPLLLLRSDGAPARDSYRALENFLGVAALTPTRAGALVNVLESAGTSFSWTNVMALLRNEAGELRREADDAAFETAVTTVLKSYLLDAAKVYKTVVPASLLSAASFSELEAQAASLSWNSNVTALAAKGFAADARRLLADKQSLKEAAVLESGPVIARAFSALRTNRSLDEAATAQKAWTENIRNYQTRSGSAIRPLYENLGAQPSFASAFASYLEARSSRVNAAAAQRLREAIGDKDAFDRALAASGATAREIENAALDFMADTALTLIRRGAMPLSGVASATLRARVRARNAAFEAAMGRATAPAPAGAAGARVRMTREERMKFVLDWMSSSQKYGTKIPVNESLVTDRSRRTTASVVTAEELRQGLILGTIVAVVATDVNTGDDIPQFARSTQPGYATQLVAGPFTVYAGAKDVLFEATGPIWVKQGERTGYIFESTSVKGQLKINTDLDRGGGSFESGMIMPPARVGNEPILKKVSAEYVLMNGKTFIRITNEGDEDFEIRQSGWTKDMIRAYVDANLSTRIPGKEVEVRRIGEDGSLEVLRGILSGFVYSDNLNKLTFAFREGGSSDPNQDTFQVLPQQIVSIRVIEPAAGARPPVEESIAKVEAILGQKHTSELLNYISGDINGNPKSKYDLNLSDVMDEIFITLEMMKNDLKLDYQLKPGTDLQAIKTAIIKRALSYYDPNSDPLLPLEGPDRPLMLDTLNALKTAIRQISRGQNQSYTLTSLWNNESPEALPGIFDGAILSIVKEQIRARRAAASVDGKRVQMLKDLRSMLNGVITQDTVYRLRGGLFGYFGEVPGLRDQLNAVEKKEAAEKVGFGEEKEATFEKLQIIRKFAPQVAAAVDRDLLDILTNLPLTESDLSAQNLGELLVTLRNAGVSPVAVGEMNAAFTWINQQGIYPQRYSAAAQKQIRAWFEQNRAGWGISDEAAEAAYASLVTIYYSPSLDARDFGAASAIADAFQSLLTPGKPEVLRIFSPGDVIGQEFVRWASPRHSQYSAAVLATLLSEAKIESERSEDVATNLSYAQQKIEKFRTAIRERNIQKFVAELDEVVMHRWKQMRVSLFGSTSRWNLESTLSQLAGLESSEIDWNAVDQYVKRVDQEMADLQSKVETTAGARVDVIKARLKEISSKEMRLAQVLGKRSIENLTPEEVAMIDERRNLEAELKILESLTGTLGPRVTSEQAIAQGFADALSDIEKLAAQPVSDRSQLQPLVDQMNSIFYRADRIFEIAGRSISADRRAARNALYRNFNQALGKSARRGAVINANEANNRLNAINTRISEIGRSRKGLPDTQELTTLRAESRRVEAQLNAALSNLAGPAGSRRALVASQADLERWDATLELSDYSNLLHNSPDFDANFTKAQDFIGAPTTVSYGDILRAMAFFTQFNGPISNEDELKLLFEEALDLNVRIQNFVAVNKSKYEWIDKNDLLAIGEFLGKALEDAKKRPARYLDRAQSKQRPIVAAGSRAVYTNDMATADVAGMTEAERAALKTVLSSMSQELTKSVPAGQTDRKGSAALKILGDSSKQFRATVERQLALALKAALEMDESAGETISDVLNQIDREAPRSSASVTAGAQMFYDRFNAYFLRREDLDGGLPAAIARGALSNRAPAAGARVTLDLVVLQAALQLSDVDSAALLELLRAQNLVTTWSLDRGEPFYRDGLTVNEIEKNEALRQFFAERQKPDGVSVIANRFAAKFGRALFEEGSGFLKPERLYFYEQSAFDKIQLREYLRPKSEFPALTDWAAFKPSAADAAKKAASGSGFGSPGTAGTDRAPGAGYEKYSLPVMPTFEYPDLSKYILEFQYRDWDALRDMNRMLDAFDAVGQLLAFANEYYPTIGQKFPLSPADSEDLRSRFNVFTVFGLAAAERREKLAEMREAISAFIEEFAELNNEVLDDTVLSGQLFNEDFDLLVRSYDEANEAAQNALEYLNDEVDRLGRPSASAAPAAGARIKRESSSEVKTSAIAEGLVNYAAYRDEDAPTDREKLDRLAFVLASMPAEELREVRDSAEQVIGRTRRYESTINNFLGILDKFSTNKTDAIADYLFEFAAYRGGVATPGWQEKTDQTASVLAALTPDEIRSVATAVEDRIARTPRYEATFNISDVFGKFNENKISALAENLVNYAALGISDELTNPDKLDRLAYVLASLSREELRAVRIEAEGMRTYRSTINILAVLDKFSSAKIVAVTDYLVEYAANRGDKSVPGWQAKTDQMMTVMAALTPEEIADVASLARRQISLSNRYEATFNFQGELAKFEPRTRVEVTLTEELIGRFGSSALRTLANGDTVNVNSVNVEAVVDGSTISKPFVSAFSLIGKPVVLVYGADAVVETTAAGARVDDLVRSLNRQMDDEQAKKGSDPRWQPPLFRFSKINDDSIRIEEAGRGSIPAEQIKNIEYLPGYGNGTGPVQAIFVNFNDSNNQYVILSIRNIFEIGKLLGNTVISEPLAVERDADGKLKFSFLDQNGQPGELSLVAGARRGGEGRQELLLTEGTAPFGRVVVTPTPEQVEKISKDSATPQIIRTANRVGSIPLEVSEPGASETLVAFLGSKDGAISLSGSEGGLALPKSATLLAEPRAPEGILTTPVGTTPALPLSLASGSSMQEERFTASARQALRRQTQKVLILWDESLVAPYAGVADANSDFEKFSQGNAAVQKVTPDTIAQMIAQYPDYNPVVVYAVENRNAYQNYLTDKTGKGAIAVRSADGLAPNPNRINVYATIVLGQNKDKVATASQRTDVVNKNALIIDMTVGKKIPSGDIGRIVEVKGVEDLLVVENYPPTGINPADLGALRHQVEVMWSA